jgi:hypothetical protein
MRTVFCGREAEMQVLTDTYRRVAIERAGPELVVIVAEAGLGKTRLVQELFGRLSTTFDRVGAAGYWPDELGQIENSLKINPAPADCNNTNPLPFLWWGLRLDDPGTKNAIVAGAVRGHMETLLPHLEPTQQARRQAARKKEAAKKAGEAAFDVALKVVPGAGLVKTAVKAVWDLWNLRAESNADVLPPSIDQVGRTQLQSVVNTLADAIGALMRPLDGAPGVPAVILFDDAQFSIAAPSATELFSVLFDRAQKEGWPLLLLVTHWQREWHTQFKPDADLKRPSGIASAIAARSDRLPVGWKPLLLVPVPNLAPMLTNGLPGIADDQRNVILARTSGNPRYLEQLVELARSRPRYFENRSPRNAMTAEGFAAFQGETPDIKRTVEQRLKDASVPVQQAVSYLPAYELIASIHGYPVNEASRPASVVSRSQALHAASTIAS